LRESGRRVWHAVREAGPPITHRDYGDTAPLSADQRRMWFLHKLEPHSTAYHVALAVRLEGRLNAAALRRAAGKLIARHEVLRTVYVDTPEGPVQKILSSDRDPSWEDLDLRNAAAPEDRTATEIRERLEVPFALTREPPLRVTLMRTADEA